MDVFGNGVSTKALMVAAGILLPAYGVAPHVAKRHVTNTGEIKRCEANLAEQARLEFERKSESLTRQTAPMPNLAPPKVGDFIEEILRPYPGGEAFCKFYNCKGVGNALPKFEMPNAAKEAAEAAKSELQALNQSFKLDIASGLSRCECAARQAINDNHTQLTLFVVTGGALRTGPVADWQAAMRKAMPACVGARG